MSLSHLRWFLLLVTVAVGTLSACGEGSQTSKDLQDATATADTNTATDGVLPDGEADTTAPTILSEVTCAASGCKLALSDGSLVVDVPAGALKGTQKLWIAESSSGDLPPHFQGPAYQLGPEGVTFDLDVTVTFKVAAPTLFNPQVVKQGTDGVWNRLSRTAPQDIPAQPVSTVSATTRAFSRFALEDVRFASPQAIAHGGEYLFVANTNLSFEGATAKYGPAWITVIRVSDRAVVKLLKSTQPNPTALAVRDGVLYVVNSGASEFDENYDPKAVGDGGLDRFTLATLLSSTGPDSNVKISAVTLGKRTRGNPAGIVFSNDGKKAYFGSTVMPELFRLTLSGTPEITTIPLYGQTAPEKSFIARPFKRPGTDQIFVVLSNEDRVVLVDAATGTVNPQSIAIDPTPDTDTVGNDLPHSVAFVPTDSGVALVLTAVSATIGVITMQGLDLKLVEDKKISQVGTYPNQLLTEGDFAYVVASGDDAVHRIQLSSMTLTESNFIKLPQAINPFEMLVVGKEAFVVGNFSNSVFVVDLTQGGTPTATIY